MLPCWLVVWCSLHCSSGLWGVCRFTGLELSSAAFFASRLTDEFIPCDNCVVRHPTNLGVGGAVFSLQYSVEQRRTSTFVGIQFAIYFGLR